MGRVDVKGRAQPRAGGEWSGVLLGGGGSRRRSPKGGARAEGSDGGAEWLASEGVPLKAGTRASSKLAGLFEGMLRGRHAELWLGELFPAGLYCRRSSWLPAKGDRLR